MDHNLLTSLYLTLSATNCRCGFLSTFIKENGLLKNLESYLLGGKSIELFFQGVSNASMKGVATLKIDGQAVDGHIIPLMSAGGIYQVEVVMV